MIIFIDTSSARSALALIRQDGSVAAEEVHDSGPTFDLPVSFRAMRGDTSLTKVAVAIGPGSFTGLRVGVSFGLGLAMGFGVPIVALRTLHLQAGRSDDQVVSVAEAGRGRVYSLAPGSEPVLVEAGDVPRDLPAVGWLRPATKAALISAGVRFRPEPELKTLGAAAAHMLKSAPEVAYGSLRLEYMQLFSARA